MWGAEHRDFYKEQRMPMSECVEVNSWTTILWNKVRLVQFSQPLLDDVTTLSIDGHLKGWLTAISLFSF